MSLHDALLAKAFGGGSGGGGVTSWDDLPDKPFGDMVEVLPETEFEIEPDFGFFVDPNYPSYALVTGYDYVIRYNGVDHPCTAIDVAILGFPCVAAGNPAAWGGEDNGLPFAVAYVQGTLGAIPLDGSTSVIVGIKAPRKLHPQYVPTQDPYVYEIDIDAFSKNTITRVCTEPELPLALLEAAYQRKPIYMKVLDKDADGIYNDVELLGLASVVGNYQYMGLALAFADKTSEIFKIPEGTVIDGTELTTQMMLYQMGIRLNTCLAPYVNDVTDFMVVFWDTTGL